MLSAGGATNTRTQTEPLTDPATTDSESVAENALLIAIGHGDSAHALEDLYARYERRLYNLGFRLLGNEGLAEELVQETFLRVWRAAIKFDPTVANAGAFIFAIARNLAIDLYRRPSSRAADELPQHDSVEDATERIVIGITVREALDTLTPAHREVVEAVYGRGERAVEVAERLGIPAATVRTRSFHGLRALGVALQRLGFDPQSA